MKTNAKISGHGFIRGMVPFVLIALLLAGTFQSCQKEDDEIFSVSLKSGITADYLLNGNLDVCFEDQVFRQTGKPGFQTVPIGSFNLLNYDDCFILNIASGRDGNGAVSAAIIRFDGQVLLNTSDFSKSEEHYTFQICNLTEESVLEVEIRGEPGSYLDIWIEGKMNSFVDARDGKRYSVVHIGEQVWMAENLAWLPEVSPNSERSATQPHFYVFGYAGNDVNEAKNNPNFASYGVLYNWPAANIASPEGWHLPSDEEWKQLEMELGMSQEHADIAMGIRGTDQGTQMKSTSGWMTNNGTNSSGFTGLAGGFLNSLTGNFFGIGSFANYWSSSEAIPTETNAWTRRLSDANNQVGRGSLGKSFGFSVRCIRD